MRIIDINSDLGESFGHYQLEDTDALTSIISSANLACGCHAGDPMVMAKTVEMCAKKGVVIGAHIGYPDLQGFGRRKMALSPEEIYNYALYQLGALDAFAHVIGVKISHINGHGALGNTSGKDPEVARAIVRAAHDYDPSLIIWAPSRESNMAKAAKEYGMRALTQKFHLDRAYTEELKLVPRGTPGAMIEDEEAALARLVRAINENKVTAITGKDIDIPTPQSVLIHGDQPKACLFAKKLRETLESKEIKIAYPDSFSVPE